MIIFGSRMYGKKNVVKTHGVCAHCGTHTQQSSYDGRKWGHVYYIPLIPSSGPVRVLKECGGCGMGQHVPQAEAEQIYGRIETLIPACVEAAARGVHTFAHPESGEPVNTDPFIADAIEMLMITGHGEDVPGLVDLLSQDGAGYEAGVAASVQADVEGRTEAAVQGMQQARDAAPDEAFAPAQLAEYSRRLGRHEAQLGYLQETSDLVGGEDVGLMLEMAGPLEALGRFDELAELLETCVAKVPQLADDKTFKKLRKKVGKKAAKM